MDYRSMIPFKVPFYFLTNLGMWQERSSSWLYRIVALLVHLFLAETFTIFHTVHLFHMAFNGSLQEFSDVLSLTFTVYAVILKTYMFIYKLNILKSMLRELQELLMLNALAREDKQLDLEEDATRVTKITNLFYGSAFVAVSTAVTMSVINHEAKILPYETSFIWDYKKNEGLFWALVVYQYFMGLYCSAINFSFDIIPVIFMSYTSSLLNELAIEVNLIGKEDEQSELNESFKKLQQCIERHIRIRKLARDISEHLTFAFILQTILSIVILCTSAFLLTTLSPITETSIFMKIFSFGLTMTLQTFLPCYYGNEVSLASDKISTALFHSNWMNKDRKFKSAVEMFLENSKKTITVIAVGVVNIDIGTFTRIGNSTYSLYALFKKMNLKI